MISYIGGKSKISEWIIPHIPTDIETYVEPFGGMFWVFFNLELDSYPNLKTVVYNDYNKLNTNLFKCTRRFDELYDMLSQLPIQKKNVIEDTTPFIETFNRFQKDIYNPDLVITDDNCMDIAMKYVYVLSSCYSSTTPHKSKFMYYKGKYRSKTLSFMDKLKKKKFRDQFNKITFIENLDYKDVIDKYDGPATYFYLDPPYYKTEKYYSNHEFGLNDHLILSNKIKDIQGRFGLSYYEFDDLNIWFPKDEYEWDMSVFKKAAGAKKGKKQNDGIEVLINK